MKDTQNHLGKIHKWMGGRRFSGDGYGIHRYFSFAFFASLR